jgi:hypothetical protein
MYYFDNSHNRCEGKATCVVSSNNSNGDPCGGTYKYTEVKYECIAP